MKYLYFFYLFLIGDFAFAQFETIQDSSIIVIKPEEKNERNNLIKANILFLAFPSVSIQYERKVFNKNSIGLSVNYTSNRNIPFLNLINRQLGDSEYTKNQLHNISINSTAISPEFKFYLGKEAFKGFYIGPFIRYAVYDVKFPMDYKVEYINYINERIDFKGRLNTFTTGISFGAQWEVLNNFYVDWLIVGPHLGFSKNSLTAHKELSERQQNAISQSLNIIKDNLQTVNNIPGVNVPNINFNYEVNNEGARIRFNEQWAGIKMLLGFGYRF